MHKCLEDMKERKRRKGNTGNSCMEYAVIRHAGLFYIEVAENPKQTNFTIIYGNILPRTH